MGPGFICSETLGRTDYFPLLLTNRLFEILRSRLCKIFYGVDRIFSNPRYPKAVPAGVFFARETLIRGDEAAIIQRIQRC
jgi:hypothetical protein